RAQTVAFPQHVRDFKKALQGAFAIAQASHVRAFLIGLQRELEVCGHIACPSFERAFLRHVVEGIVDLYGAKPRSVELQHFLCVKLLGIKISFPRFVGVTRSSDIKLSRLRHIPASSFTSWPFRRRQRWR